MKAVLVGDETYDEPPRLGSGVLVGVKGLVHIVHVNHGIRVRMFCTDHEAPWTSFHVLDRGWFEYPTCVLCALHPLAIIARMEELAWRVEWWQREAGQLSAPKEIEPLL